MPATPVTSRAATRRVLALCPALIGAAALLGWTLGIPELKSVLPGLTTMKANTALGLIASGAGLLLIPSEGGGFWRRGLALAAGAFACLLGLLTLVEYVSGTPLGIDQFLFPDPNTTSPPYPGRMSPATAAALACTGAAVLLLAWAERAPRPAGLAHLLAVVPAGVGYLSLAGYAYQVEGLYSFGPSATVALHTAAALGLLAAAILRTMPELGWGRAFADRPVAHGVLARLVPLALFLPFLAGAFAVWGARASFYDPWFSPALLALAAACVSILLTWIAASTVRRAEGRLRESNAQLTAAEARLRLFIEHTPAPIAMFDRDMRYLAASRRFLGSYGLPEQDIIGRSHYEIFPDLPPRWRDAHARCLAGAVETCEADPFPRATGHTDWVRWEIQPWRQEDGAIGGLMLFSEVITARVEGEAEARRTAALLEAIGASSPDLIYAKDTKGRMLYANPATLALIGKPAEAVLGRTAAEYADDPEEGAAHLGTDLRIIAAGATESIDEPYTSPDGTRRVWQSTKAPLRDPAGTVFGLVCISTDSTARREAERRQAFLMALADRLHAAPREAMAEAAELLGTHLGVSRTGYGEVDEPGGRITVSHEHTDGTVPPALGTHVLAEFGPAIVEELRAGRTVVVADAASDPRTRGASAAHLALGTRSIVTVPLVREGALRATLYVNHRDPRPWTGEEVRLVEEVAARTWAVVEQARAEAALERTADEFRTLADGIPTLCWMADPDGHIYWYNWRWHEYTGTTHEQMEGWGWRSVHDPDVLPFVLERWRASIATGTPFEMTFPLRGADGQFRPFLTRIVPVRGADGRIRRWLGVNTDVSEALAREQALRRSEARFRATADALPGMLFVATAAGKNTYVNEGFCAYTGRKREDLLDDRWVEILHSDDAARASNTWNEAVRTGSPYLAEYRFRRHDGAWRWHMVRALPSREADGAIHRWVGTCTDIHDRYVLEEELRRLTQSLEARVEAEVAAREAAQARAAHAERMQALGQLAGGIAHDLNNVLQAVQGGTMLIERRARDPESTRRLAKMVLEAVARGASITRRLLSFARRGDLRAEPVDVAALFEGLQDILTHALGASVAVRLDVAPGLPKLLADKGQLETALVNLATNARDAMPDGGTLTLAANSVTVDGDAPHPAGLAHGRYVRVCVKDTGTGMNQATLARVMEPFFTTKPHGKGTGLGLPMAQGFAEQSGGALHVESALGRGTTVTLWLPQAGDAPPAIARPDLPLREAPPGAGAGAAGRVLLVDDEAMVRETLAQELEEAGYAVLPAPDAGAALAAMGAGQEQEVDVLVTDLTMPGGMDGLALIREA
ncbi:MAG TPA: PAS domain-containing protein, partial [Acetobacteraceae bacterium]|nr:PAS domain-containing protein [Acetobacteraceae bacterium]